jgi:hypothetical protein
MSLCLRITSGRFTRRSVSEGGPPDYVLRNRLRRINRCELVPKGLLWSLPRILSSGLAVPHLLAGRNYHIVLTSQVARTPAVLPNVRACLSVRRTPLAKPSLRDGDSFGADRHRRAVVRRRQSLISSQWSVVSPVRSDIQRFNDLKYGTTSLLQYGSSVPQNR